MFVIVRFIIVGMFPKNTMHEGIEEHLADPIAALDYVMSLIEERFPDKVGKVWSDTSIVSVKNQVARLEGDEAKYERVLRYVRGVFSGCVPGKEQTSTLAALTVAPGVSNSKEMLDHMVYMYLNHQ